MQVTYTYDSAGNRTSVVTQTGTNRPPQINNDHISVLKNGSDTFNPLTIDTDPNGYTLTITGVDSPVSPQHGSATYTSSSITYTPTSGYPSTGTATDSFTYAVSNGHGGTGSATIYATIGGLGPTANPDSVSTSENTALTYDPRTNDIEPTPPGYSLTIASTTTPSHGTVAINSGTSLTYTPTAGYLGGDSFSYTISDGHGLTSTAVDTVAMGAPPVAVTDYSTTPTNTAETFDPRTNDSDANNFPLTIASTTMPAHGTVAIVDSATQLTYTPTSGYSGLDSFNYTISDGHGLTATATDYVCVGYAAPTAPASSVTIRKYISSPWTPNITFDPATGDTVSCGQSPTIISVTQGTQGGSVVLYSGSSVMYTYYALVGVTNENYDVDTFTYTITEPFGGTATGTVTVDLHVIYNGGP
jgi:hypothetical protein